MQPSGTLPCLVGTVDIPVLNIPSPSRKPPDPSPLLSPFLLLVWDVVHDIQSKFQAPDHPLLARRSFFVVSHIVSWHQLCFLAFLRQEKHPNPNPNPNPICDRQDPGIDHAAFRYFRSAPTTTNTTTTTIHTLQFACRIGKEGTHALSLFLPFLKTFPLRLRLRSREGVTRIKQPTHTQSNAQHAARASKERTFQQHEPQTSHFFTLFDSYPFLSSSMHTYTYIVVGTTGHRLSHSSSKARTRRRRGILKMTQKKRSQ
jgi:hypothetical protein